MYDYKSPIEIYTEQILAHQEQAFEKATLEAVVNVGVSVDKDELIKALQYDRQQYDKGYEDGYNADKWISVKDRLPDKEGTYLTYTDKNKMLLDSFVIYPSHNTKFWVGGNGKVTHWQPLPEPPELLKGGVDNE